MNSTSTQTSPKDTLDLENSMSDVSGNATIVVGASAQSR
jgi:hypothetical protein